MNSFDIADRIVLKSKKFAEQIEKCFAPKGERIYLDPSEALYLFHTRQVVIGYLNARVYGHSDQEYYAIKRDEGYDESKNLTLESIISQIFLPLTRGQDVIVQIHDGIFVQCKRWGNDDVRSTIEHPELFW